MKLELIDYREENKKRAIEGGKLHQVLMDFEVRNGDMILSQGDTEIKAWKNAAKFLSGIIIDDTDKELEDISQHVELLRKYVIAEQEIAELKVKADLWDSLLSVDRIRILGTAEMGGEHQHFGMEIWEHHTVKDSQYGKDTITTFAETILKKRG